MNFEIFQDSEFLNKVSGFLADAGTIQMSFFKNLKKIEFKNDQSFITEADIESDKFLRKCLSTIIPDCGFITEELGSQNIENEYVWIVDPLDGTKNFAYGIPYFCISIALAYKKRIIFGAIYEPVRNELFYAIYKQGAFLNGKKVTIYDSTNEKDQLLFSVGGSRFENEHKILRKIFDNKLSSRISFRKFGASALNIAYLCDNRLDAVICDELMIWDVAAGSLIISESGGEATSIQIDSDSNKIDLFVASSKKLYPRVLQIIR